MKTYIWKLFLIILLSMTLGYLYNGCSQNPTEENVTDEEAIKELLETQISSDDPEVYSLQGINDDGAQSPEYDLNLPKTSEQINTIRFGRRGKMKLESITVDFIDDTTAVATIYHSFDGNFFILVRDTSGVTAMDTLYKKEMANTLVRKVILKKVRHTRFPRLNWGVRAVSMAMAYSPDPTVEIHQITIDLPNTDEDIVVTDPLEYFMNRQTAIPTFSPGDTVKVFLTVTNTNSYPPEPGTTALLHWGARRQMHRARRPFNDEGIYPDAVAGDGIFSGYWIIHHKKGIRHAVVDVIDNGTIFDDVAPYNAVAWGTPYKVE